MALRDAFPSRNLPLLNFSKSQYKFLNLKNTLIISVQHLYASTYSMFRVFFELGLEPRNLYVLGKCYSTDPKIYKELKKINVEVSELSQYFDSHKPYDEEFDKFVDLFLYDVMKKNDLYQFEKIIILDDGGHLLARVIKLFPANLNIVGIEQTSSGYNRLKEKQIFFPIVNLSRAWLKLEYESPIIINLAKRKIFEKIKHFQDRIRSILILGYGAIGQHIYQNLKDSFNVQTFDIRNAASQNYDLNMELKNFDMIIGCTGVTSLPACRHKFLKKSVVLASLSSTDREFDAVHLRRFAPQIFNCHSDMKLNDITLLNCGFPVNFDHDHEKIDTDDFQLTRSLLLAAVAQAAVTQNNTHGFIDMDNEIQIKLLNELNAYSKKEV